jgi:hypothetical protein
MPLIIPANSITGGYEVDNSLRFNDGSSDTFSINLDRMVIEKHLLFHVG